MRSWLLVVLGIVFSTLVVGLVIYSQRVQVAPPVLTSQPVALSAPGVPSPSPLSSPLSGPSPVLSPGPSPSSFISPPDPLGNLAVDENGLSHATAIINTTEGVIKFKFYSKDAPNTVKRIAELIEKGFYNGLTFHRIVPGFVVQGGDPSGTGTGGSGQKLKAEFNHRRHVEGSIAMARAADPDSADSQFYICLGTHPHLDHSYTVFGQVIEGMDIVKKLKVGDKMTSIVIQ